MTRCWPDVPAAPVRIVLVCSEADVTSGLTRRLARCDGLAVVGSFPSIATAVAGMARLHPDVVLVDAEVVDGSGHQLCAGLQRAGHRLACLVHAGLPLDSGSAPGVDGVVLKSLTGDLLERELIKHGLRMMSDQDDVE